MKVRRGATRAADGYQDQEKSHDRRGHQLLKIGAEAYATIVDESEKYSKRYAEEQAIEKNRLACDSIDLDGIEPGENVRSNLSQGDCFPRAHDEIRQQHDPAREITDHRGKHLCGIRSFPGCVGQAQN